MSGLSKEDKKACMLSLMATLAAIHNVDYESVGLGDYGRAGGYFVRQTKSLSKVSAVLLLCEDVKM